MTELPLGDGPLTAAAGAIANFLTNLVKGAWGGGPEHETPPIVPLLSALLFGLLIVALMAVAMGLDLTQPAAAARMAIQGMLAASLANLQHAGARFGRFTEQVRDTAGQTVDAAGTALEMGQAAVGAPAMVAGYIDHGGSPPPPPMEWRK